MSNAADMFGGGGSSSRLGIQGQGQLSPFQQSVMQQLGQTPHPNSFAQAVARKLALASGDGYTPVDPNNVGGDGVASLQNLPDPTQQPGSHVYMSPTSDPQAFDQVLRSLGLGKALPDKMDPYEALSAQLMSQINSINNQFTPDETLRQQAQAQASAQYDPVIALLKGDMSRTQTRAGENEDKARQMYGSLADSFMNSIGDIQNQGQQAQNQASSRYDNAASQMQQQYQNQASQQQAIMNRLGIQAAEGDPRLQQVQNDQSYFQNMMQADKQHQLDMLQGQNQADQGYQRGISSSSRMAGENTAQDISRQLENYLGQANDKLTGLETSKNADIVNLFNQLKGADQQRVSQSNKDAFSQMMALNNFQLDALKAQNQNTDNQNNLQLKLQELQQKMNGTALGQNSGMSGAANLLAQRYGQQDVGKAQLLQNILNQVLQDPSVVSGKQTVSSSIFGDTQAPITPEFVMQKLRELAGQNNVQGGDINNLMDAYLAYSGKLR